MEGIMNTQHPQLSYGICVYQNSPFDYETCEPIQWVDTMAEVETYLGSYFAAHGTRQAYILVYGLASHLTTIRYKPWGMGSGFSFFGIRPELQALADANGITDAIILGED